MAEKDRPDLFTVCDVVQSWGPKSGGVKRYVKDKARRLERLGGHRHVLIVPEDEDDVREEGVTRVHAIKSLPIVGSKGYHLLLNRSRILETIEAEKPDIIEVGNPYYPAWVALEAGRSRGVPVVGFYHSDFPRSLGDKLVEQVNSLAGLGEVVTGAMESYLAGLYNKMSATVTATRHFEGLLRDMGVTNVVRCPLGTDTEVFKPKDSRAKVFAELGLSEDTMLLLFVGRFAGMKNLEELLAMMDRFTEADGPVHLALVGDGELAPLVRKAHEQRDDVTWLPYTKDAGVLAERYSAADLCINPGVHETFGLVSVEAQACGTRVLGVAGGGMDETLEGEDPRIMAESPDPDHLAAAVRRVRALGEEPGGTQAQARRRRMVEKFSIDVNMERIVALYRHLCEGGTAAGFPDLT